MAYTDPKTGTTYTSPEVAKQNGVDIGNASSGIDLATQTLQANQASPTINPIPIDTTVPNPATVNATPSATPATPTQPVSGNLNQTAPVIPATPQTNLQQGLKAAQASGPAPQEGGAARSAVANFTPPTPPSTANIDAQLAQDKGYQQLLADRAEYNNVANQGKSLLDFYNQATKDAGIPALNEQLVNYKKIIDGTEDDIRKEVQSTGGLATDSQILALSSARNKSLIKNYNALLDSKSMAMESINNMVNLASQDRQFALQSISQKMQFDQQINEYRDKFVNNAKEAYANIINAIGYSGLLQSLHDPSEVALAEKTLGLAPGQLQQIVTAQQSQTNLKTLADYTVTTPYIITASGEVQNSKTGEGYKSPQDFQAKTGMTLDQAGAKGLIKPLGLNKKEVQQEFENKNTLAKLAIDKAQLGVSQYNAQTSRINATQADTSVVDTGDGKVLLTYDKKGNIINQQPIRSTSGASKPQALAQAQGNINLVGDLLNKVKTPSSVGVGSSTAFRNFLSNPFSSKKSDFIAGVQQLTSQLSLDSLIRAKAAGATFGALSEGELNILSGSASRLNSWAIKDKNGNVTGYNTSATSFKNELDKINNLAKLDYVLKGGNAEDVGVIINPDGSATTLGSDGKIHQIYP